MVPRVSPPELAVTPTETCGLMEEAKGGEGEQPAANIPETARKDMASREVACLEKELMPLLYHIATRFPEL